MYGTDSNPYGDYSISENKVSHDHILPNDNREKEETIEEIKEPSKDSVTYHLDNRIKILKTKAEEKFRNESLVNLASFGAIAVVGFLLFKRYLK
jgi:hypothetical protein